MKFFSPLLSATALACLGMQPLLTAPAAAQTAQASPRQFSDAEVQSFLAASPEIDPLNREFAAAADTNAQRDIIRRIDAAFARHNINVDTYNAIATRAAQDASFAARVNALRGAPRGGPDAAYSDARVRAFVEASAEVDPLAQTLSTAATPEARDAAASQIRAALERHNIDLATYNAIAQTAQTDTELAARINAMRAPPPASDAAEE